MFFITSMRMGGAEHVMATLASALAAKGHAVTLVSLQSRPRAYDLDERVDYREFGFQLKAQKGILRPFNLIACGVRALKQYRAILKEIKPDIIISFLINANLFAVIHKLFFRKDPPVIVSERSDPRKLSSILQRILRFFYARADYIVCQGDKIAAYYQENRRARTAIILNPINTDCVAPEAPAQRTKRIVAVGKLMKQKNYDLLLDSFAIVSQALPDYRLEIYGIGGEQERLAQKAETLGIADKVFFMGLADRVMQKVADASLYVMSSDYEGLPNALMEALASGIPAISTDFPSGTARELIQDGKNGRLVPVGNAQALAAAMADVLTHPEQAEAMGRAGREILQKLSAEQIVSQWEALTAKVTEKGATACSRESA